MTSKLPQGTVHQLPNDLAIALVADKLATSRWEEITPLARNEWICWVENAKQLTTRNRRIERVSSELKEGINRPCCWIGCIHRTDKEISPSVKGILARQKRK